jgi:sugar phosphate isomerase/epimerase
MPYSIHRRDFLAAAAAAAGWAAPQGRMYLSLNSTLTSGGKLSWPEFARLAASSGYGGVDLNLGAAMKEGVDATRALLAELKIKASNCGAPANLRGDDAAFQASLKRTEEAAQFAAAIDCRQMTAVIMSGSDRPKEEMRKFVKDRLAAVGEVLARHQVRLGLEFLGPLHIRSRSPHEFIWRMNEMLEFGKECGPNIGLLLDAWHWHHAGGSVADIVAAGKAGVVHVHVSDSAKLPPEEVRDNQRLMPGEGVIDLVGFFRALGKIGYQDGISPEVLGRIPKDMPPEEGARLGRDTTLAVMRKAGVA